MKSLVAYFSASGVTREFASKICEKVNGELYEIKPITEYSKSDLNWMNPLSRSSKEMRDKNSRPEIKDELPNIEKYDKIYVGFPVWWYTCPHIIDTFLEHYNFDGKEVIVFFTSGSTKEDKIQKSMEGRYPYIKKYVRVANDSDIDKL